MSRKLFLSIASESVIITANRRLAFYLQTLDSEKHCSSIEAFETWILNLWSQQHSTQRILTEAEQSYLWQQVISTSLADHPLLQVSTTAQLAQQAWQNLKLWRKGAEDLDPASGLEVKQFIQWAKAFEQHCRNRNLICPVELPLKLLEQARNLKLAKEIILVGFDELAPLHHHFFQQLNTKVRFLQNEPKQALIHRVSCHKTSDELYLMACWAKAYLTHHSSAVIACIVPELSNLREEVQRIFTEVFANSGFDFNISAGQNLAQFSLIKTALTILNLKLTHNSWESISTLLNSNYLNTSLENSLMAAEAELNLRKTAQNHWVSLDTVKTSLNYLKENYPNADFNERWQAWQNQVVQAPNQALASEWCLIFKTELELLGWPAHHKSNPEELGLLEQWEIILTELTQFDALSGKVTRSTALNLLNQLAQIRIFQPKNKASRLQILGLLEASGLDFEALWVMSLSDRNWPQAAQPNPFIPYYQQRQWQMPHASAERELHYCLELQARLLASANIIVLSYAEEDSHLKQGPSRLIKDFPALTHAELIRLFNIEHFVPKTQQLFKQRQIEFISDDRAPKISSNEVIAGGSFILKEQAICPFKAFARIRLKAFGLNEPELGLDNISKGVFAHKALELFWKKIKDQRTLNNLSPVELNQTIEQCVDAALRNSAENPVLLEIESSRLIKILSEWLDFEKTRRSFRVVAEEAAFQVEVGPLKLNLRIDRIDELEDGSHLIMDYKSGDTSIASWFNDRITEPQLPLYATYAFTHAKAIAFAQLQAGKMKLTGICSNDNNHSGLTPPEKSRSTKNGKNWDNLIQHWKISLNQSAHDFYEGKASVDPHNPAIACQHCDLQGLCRINEEA